MPDKAKKMYSVGWAIRKLSPNDELVTNIYFKSSKI